MPVNGPPYADREAGETHAGASFVGERSGKPSAGTLLTISVNKADTAGIVSFDTSGAWAVIALVD
jgi:hypothetical protein